MAKQKMSREARRKISQAAKRRWRAYRKAKKSGVTLFRPGPKPGKRRGRKPGPRRGRRPVALAGNTEFGALSMDDLIATRRRIDQELADRLVRGAA